MQNLFLVCLLAFTGCATFKPSPQAKALIRTIDDRVPVLVQREVDRPKPNFKDPYDLGDYFRLCAAVINNEALRENPPQLEIAASVSEVVCIGRTPEALAVVLQCLDLYEPFLNPQDSSTVLREIAQKICDASPSGFRPWWMPKPKRHAD